MHAGLGEWGTRTGSLGSFAQHNTERGEQDKARAREKSPVGSVFTMTRFLQLQMLRFTHWLHSRAVAKVIVWSLGRILPKKLLIDNKVNSWRASSNIQGTEHLIVSLSRPLCLLLLLWEINAHE